MSAPCETVPNGAANFQEQVIVIFFRVGASEARSTSYVSCTSLTPGPMPCSRRKLALDCTGSITPSSSSASLETMAPKTHPFISSKSVRHMPCAVTRCDIRRAACEAELRAMYDAATRRLISAAATTASTRVKPPLGLLVAVVIAGKFMALLSAAAGDSVGVRVFVVIDGVFASIGGTCQY